MTILSTRKIDNLSVANEIFGGINAADNDNETPMVLIPGRSCCCPYVAIPTGMYALVQVSGRDTNGEDGTAAWKAGFHWASCFPCNQKRVSHLVTKQAIVFDTPVSGCKTADDVSVSIDVCVVLRIMGETLKGEDPELVREFVYKLGPSELSRQLADAQDERVRALARSMRHTEVYALGANVEGGADREAKVSVVGKDGYLEAKEDDSLALPGDAPESIAARAASKGRKATLDMKHRFNLQFNKYGVEILDVNIQRVHLPMNFEKQMEERTTYGVKIEEQKMKQIKDMQDVKQKEDMTGLRQKHNEEQSLEQEVGRKQEAEVKERLENEIAVTKKILDTLQEEGTAKKRVIQARSGVVVERANGEATLIHNRYKADAEAKVEGFRADCVAYEATKHADASISESKDHAASKSIVAEAEGKAAPKLRHLREFLLIKQQIQMHGKLSENRNVVITGKNAGQGMLPDMLMSQQQSRVLFNVGSEVGSSKAMTR